MKCERERWNANLDAGIVSVPGRSVAVNLSLRARAKRAGRRSVASSYTYLARVRRAFDGAAVMVKSEDCTNRVLFAVKGKSWLRSGAALLRQARQLEMRYPIAFQQVATHLSEPPRLPWRLFGLSQAGIAA